ncbi:MAG: potassium transporter Kup [Deltaproteobacteria bacterium]|nr:potassium transporter Kup [Deltaproteobacteria bacterium]
MTNPQHPSDDGHHGGSLQALVIGAIGIVFGDIGTSPLYAFQECVGSPHGVAPTRENVLGVLSLIIWSLMMVVTVKYLGFIMRADNRGEGGIFSLLALLPERARTPGRVSFTPVALAVLVGAGLLYGDGIITPAISVLSAVEGIKLVAPSFEHWVVPTTVVILLGLFGIQRHGTAGIGRLFGPVMILWFAVIGSLGLWHLVHNPTVLAAFSPLYGVRFFAHHGWHGFKLLGSVVLCVTGGEALYADMGHFGAKSIRYAWLGFIFPALVLCYLGQGALVLGHPELARTPFFGMVPVGGATIALVALAAPATVIASQALISGVFSLTQQAVRLGYLPRVLIRHTSGSAEGQIYIPSVNWGLAIACIALVLAFKESSALAAAYGLAVCGTMAITSITYFAVIRETWGWSRGKSWALLLLFLAFDIPYLLANLLKFFDGGYLPVLVGAFFFVVMIVWKMGRTHLGDYFAERSPPLSGFLESLASRVSARTPGTSVFLASSATGTPPVLFHHVERLRVLQERVVLLTITTEHIPMVSKAGRVKVEDIAPGVYRVIARCGFMETPQVPAMLAQAIEEGLLPIKLADVTYYLGRETFIAGTKGKMGPWTESLFAFLNRNAHSAPMYFGVPAEKVVELGVQIDL